MSKAKTILFDLDGTLTNTMHPEFRAYRDGQATININRVPFFLEAKELIHETKKRGNQVFIVSDSHPKFVRPIAAHLGLQSLSLAYKPTIEKTQEFIQSYSNIKLPSSRIFLVGDTYLDIRTAKKLGIPSIQIMHSADYKPKVWMKAQKEGPTFSCNSYGQLLNIIDNPGKNLLTIEGLKYGKDSIGEIQIDGLSYKASAGRKRFQIALARQETGPCDIFARSDWYRTFSSRDRNDEFLKKIATGVKSYLYHFMKERDIKFDYLSYVADKKTTVPPKKMEYFTQMIDCSIPNKSIFEWDNNVEGSIRFQPNRSDRYSFVKKFLRLKSDASIYGKNIIVIDDQLTTGATMDAITDLLWNNGGNHILFLSLFRMISEGSTEKKCPQCNKQ